MKIKIILAAFIVCTAHSVIMDSTSEFNYLKTQYPKLRFEWYQTICTECVRYVDYKMSPSDICAIIQGESEFNAKAINFNYKNNKVVSTDHSLMQINSCFGIYDEPIENLRKGIYEYHLCLVKAKGNKKEANRLYNAGRNNKPENYKNWDYVKKIDKNRNVSLVLRDQVYQVR